MKVPWGRLAGLFLFGAAAWDTTVNLTGDPAGCWALPWGGCVSAYAYVTIHNAIGQTTALYIGSLASPVLMLRWAVVAAYVVVGSMLASGRWGGRRERSPS